MRSTNVPITPLNSLRQSCPLLSGVEWQGAGVKRGLIPLKSLGDIIAFPVVALAIKVTPTRNTTNHPFNAHHQVLKQLEPCSALLIRNALQAEEEDLAAAEQAGRAVGGACPG